MPAGSSSHRFLRLLGKIEPLLGCEVLRSWAKESGIRACRKLSFRKPSSDSSSCTDFVQWPPIAAKCGCSKCLEMLPGMGGVPILSGETKKGHGREVK